MIQSSDSVALLPKLLKQRRWVLPMLGGLLLASTSADAALIIHWNLDETSGTTANDIAGTPQNGTLFNPAVGSGWVPGFFGNAYSFVGGNTNEVIAVTGLANNAGPFVSWSAWVKRTSSSTGMVAGNISGNSSVFNEYAGLYAASTARILKRNNATVTNPIGTTTVNNNEWHHVVGTIDWIDLNSNGLVDTAEQTRRVYVNGILEGTFAETLSRINTSRFSVGANARGNFTVNAADIIDEFAGIIDDVGYWNHAIDEVEIALIHGLGRFSGVTLSDAAIAAVRAAWAAGTGNSAVAGSHTWYYTDGLTGVTGTIGGSVASLDAFIVLNGALGTGVTLLIPEPVSITILSMGIFLFSRPRKTGH